MKSEENNVTINIYIEDDYYISGSLAMNMLTFYIDLVCFLFFFIYIYYSIAPKQIYDDKLD